MEKARFRRTNRMIEIDNKRQEAGLPAVPWATLPPEEQDLFNDDPLRPLNGSSGGVKYVELKENGSGSEADAFDVVVAQAVAKAVDQVYQQMLQLVKKSQNSRVVAAVKINDGPIAKIDGMHPLVPEVVGLTEGLAQVGSIPLLVGPAGSGKTLIAEQVAQALGLPFSHLCFTAGASETWLFGRQTPNGFVVGEFANAYANGGVFLADEIDAADANLLLCLNTAIANGHLYNPISGQLIKRHPKFRMIAAANTVGKGGDGQYTGRCRLDGATLNRTVCVPVEYRKDIEEAMAGEDTDCLELIWKMRAHVEKNGGTEIISYRQLSQAIVLKRLGKTLKEIAATLTYPWAAELRESFVASQGGV